MTETVAAQVEHFHHKAVVRGAPLDPAELSQFLKLGDLVIKASMADAALRATDSEMVQITATPIQLPNKQLAEAIRAAKRQRDDNSGAE